jgi:hypothetical protein
VVSQSQWATVTFAKTGWFETEDELDGIQRAFVGVLRAHAEAWPLDPVETCLVLPGYEAYGYPLAPGQPAYGRLLVYVISLLRVRTSSC